MTSLIAETAQIADGQEPIVATAVHNGHELRPEVAALIALPEADRLREEDPFTGIWTSVVTNQLVALRSRFEVDLNRPRDKAVYREPADAWGLRLWREELPPEVVERSLQEYDAFYAETARICSELERRYGRFVVLDLHSYNHRRQGPDAPADDPQANPEVNVGTGSMDRDRWGGLVDRFMADLRAHEFLGRQLDVRENVRFQGGYLSRWIHEQYPESGCCLAIEFKKFFMDEWTGVLSPEEYEAIPQALEATLPGLLESLGPLE
ncbi:MAG: N-formylglutamate amidohydrolase [Chloroflexota bacterium]